jgi:hypothetical protein
MPQLPRMMNPKEIRKSSSNERENIKEYYLVSALSSTIITGPKTWLVNSGASKHMTGYKEILLDFKKKSFVEQVELGDDKCFKEKFFVEQVEGDDKFLMGKSYLHCRVYSEQVSTCYLEGQDF